MIVDGHGEGGSISYFEYQEGRFRILYRAKGTASLGAFYALRYQSGLRTVLRRIK